MHFNSPNNPTKLSSTYHNILLNYQINQFTQPVGHYNF